MAEVWSAGSKDEEVQLKHFKMIASEKEKAYRLKKALMVQVKASFFRTYKHRDTNFSPNMGASSKHLQFDTKLGLMQN